MDAAVAISAAVPPGAADPDIERARELAAAIVATNRGRKKELGLDDRDLEAFSVAAELGDRNPLIPLHAAQCHLALGNPAAAGRALDDALAWDGPEHAQAGIRERAARLRETVDRRTA